MPNSLSTTINKELFLVWNKKKKNKNKVNTKHIPKYMHLQGVEKQELQRKLELKTLK